MRRADTVIRRTSTTECFTLNDTDNSVPTCENGTANVVLSKQTLQSRQNGAITSRRAIALPIRFQQMGLQLQQSLLVISASIRLQISSLCCLQISSPYHFLLYSTVYQNGNNTSQGVLTVRKRGKSIVPAGIRTPVVQFLSDSLH